MSSIIACSSPRLAGAVDRRVGHLRDPAAGSLSSSARPSAWASRRAGSIVSTATAAPGRPRARASAALVVVLPTPPEPQQHEDPDRAVVEQRVDVEERARLMPRTPHHPGPPAPRRARKGAEVHAVDQVRQLQQWAPSPPRRRAIAAASTSTRTACSTVSATSPSIISGARPRPPRPARSGSAPRPPGRPRPAPRSGPAATAGRTRLTITAPGRRSAAASSAIVSRVSVTGRSSSSVTRCTAVRGECSRRTTPSLWLWIGPVAREVRHRPRDVEEADDAARRRGVEDDGVVDRPPGAVLAGDALLGLAREQDVAQPRGQRGGELDGPHAAQRPAGDAEPVEHLQVLQQRRLGIDGQRAHLASAGRDGDLPLLVGQGRGVEHLRDALPALHLDQQRPAAAGGQRQRQRRGRGRLPGAALARHDVEADRGQRGRPAGGMHRTSLCGARGDRPVRAGEALATVPA